VHLYLQGCCPIWSRKNARKIAAWSMSSAWSYKSSSAPPWIIVQLLTVWSPSGQQLENPMASSPLIPAASRARDAILRWGQGQWCSHRGKSIIARGRLHGVRLAPRPRLARLPSCPCPRSGPGTSDDRHALPRAEAVSYRTRHEQCLEMLDLWWGGWQGPHGLGDG